MKARRERETMVRQNAGDGVWDVFTEDRTVIRRMVRLFGPGRPVGDGFEWQVPQQAVQLRKPLRRTEESKAKLVEALQRARAARARRGGPPAPPPIEPPAAAAPRPEPLQNQELVRNQEPVQEATK